MGWNPVPGLKEFKRRKTNRPTSMELPEAGITGALGPREGISSSARHWKELDWWGEGGRERCFPREGDIQTGPWKMRRVSAGRGGRLGREHPRQRELQVETHRTNGGVCNCSPSPWWERRCTVSGVMTQILTTSEWSWWPYVPSTG